MTEQPATPTAAVSGYSPTTPNATATPPTPPAPTTSTDPLGYIHAIEGDIGAAIQHPTPTTVHKAAADVLSVLGVILTVIGIVQSVVPPSRGTESAVLTALGAGTVAVMHAIERFAG